MTTLQDKPIRFPIELLRNVTDRFGWHTKESVLDTYPELGEHWNLIVERINQCSIYFSASQSLLISQGFSEEEFLVTKVRVSRSRIPFLTPCELPYKIQLSEAPNDLIIKDGCLKVLLRIKNADDKKFGNETPLTYEELIHYKGYMFFSSKKHQHLLVSKAGTNLKGKSLYRIREVVITPSGYLSVVRPNLYQVPNSEEVVVIKDS